MRRVIPCLSFSSLSIALALTGCAAGDDPGDDTSEAGGAATIAGRWQLPGAVHAVAQAQFVAYDDAPPWNGPSGCSGTFFSGTAKLKSYLLAAFSGISAIGGYDCRPNTANTSQTSIHGTGRALDVMVPTIGGDANNTVGDAIGNYLITHATEFGIQLVIWDRSVWQANLSGEKLRAYTGPIPHVDHLHVELNKAAGEREDTAFFRNGIIRITAGDVNGDGHGDVLGRKADGTLLYYANTTDPSAPFGSGVLVGTGWDVFDRVLAADLSGDGFADLVATRPDGTLWYYPNGFHANPTSPFSTGNLIGSGWSVFNSLIATDLNGDGFDDLVASRPDGTLWYYANSKNPSAPFATGALIGTGWQIYNKLIAADIGGDGFGDVVATRPDGTLWYYANSRNPSAPFSTGALIGTGWTIFDTLLATDLHGDGPMDVVAAKPDGTLWQYANSGNATAPFATGAQIGAGWSIFHR